MTCHLANTLQNQMFVATPSDARKQARHAFHPWESDTAPEVRVGPATAVRHGRRLQVQAGDAAAGTSFFAASADATFAAAVVAVAVAAVAVAAVVAVATAAD